jgi:hypothetical protein
LLEGSINNRKNANKYKVVHEKEKENDKDEDDEINMDA